MPEIAPPKTENRPSDECPDDPPFRKRNLVVAVGGASGAIYAQVLLNKLESLQAQVERVGVVFSDNGRAIWEHELGQAPRIPRCATLYERHDFFAPFASGSAGYDAMIICPCSMGMVGRIAAGVSDCLTTRAADVMLKERRRLILVTRETPLSQIHLNNMQSLTQAGAIICPACPSFYSQPRTLEDMAATVVDRVLDLAGFNVPAYRWQM